MSEETDQNPFQRKVMTREPGIVGAQWWNEGLTAMSDPVTRRKALQALAVLGGTVAVGGLVLSAAGDDEDDEEDEYLELQDSLKVQRERGWNFGATGNALAFAGQTQDSLKPEDLAALSTELAPKQDTLKPYYQATLFQSVSGNLMGEARNASATLRKALRPIFTPDMDTAFKQGSALASLFSKQQEAALATAVLVDLPGPESVAFAIALAERFEPVFTYDNWPHPRGVVPAHLTLAAVAFYQPTLRKLAQQRPVPAPPMFVLDRHRLAPYSDERVQFDNRYVARMPTAEQLRKLGVQHVLYVVPNGKTQVQELDDLNEDFVAWRAAGLDVKLVAANDFRPDPTEPVTSVVSSTQPVATDGGTPVATPNAGTARDAGISTDAGTLDAGTPSTRSTHVSRAYYFGGSPAVHHTFWSVYPWSRSSASTTGRMLGLSSAGILSTRDLAQVPSDLSRGYAYEPMRRSTMFSSVPRGASGAPRPVPSGFGKVAMRVSSKSRAILGPAFSSRSSWNRSSSSYSGG
ncbi:hypothetical protein F0U60_19560 [Archangium minus]|uniref:Uncharacterized protein n=1 Tax=Archangium minus TaxID=83450 RepID=A0ABY9WS29_9BACT|nr:hypothetical protein F0U60_19560 [Archangium minus]